MGYRKDLFVDQVHEIFRCGLCNKVASNPRVTAPKNCHTFCADCIPGPCSGTCPVCSAAMEGFESPPDHALAVYNSYQVHCDTWSRGGSVRDTCQWTGSLGSLSLHIRTCSFSVNRCSNDGCETVVNCRLLDQHRQECPSELLLCFLCKYGVRRGDLEEHYREWCPRVCPFGGREKCGPIAPTDHEAHRSRCPFAMVFCPFEIVGCQHQAQRKDMSAHLAANMHEHPLLVQEHMAALTVQIRAYKLQLAARTEELRQTNQDLISTRQGAGDGSKSFQEQIMAKTVLVKQLNTKLDEVQKDRARDVARIEFLEAQVARTRELERQIVEAAEKMRELEHHAASKRQKVVELHPEDVAKIQNNEKNGVAGKAAEADSLSDLDCNPHASEFELGPNGEKVPTGNDGAVAKAEAMAADAHAVIKAAAPRAEEEIASAKSEAQAAVAKAETAVAKLRAEKDSRIRKLEAAHVADIAKLKDLELQVATHVPRVKELETQHAADVVQIRDLEDQVAGKRSLEKSVKHLLQDLNNARGCAKKEQHEAVQAATRELAKATKELNSTKQLYERQVRLLKGELEKANKQLLEVERDLQEATQARNTAAQEVCALKLALVRQSQPVQSPPGPHTGGVHGPSTTTGTSTSSSMPPLNSRPDSTNVRNLVTTFNDRLRAANRETTALRERLSILVQHHSADTAAFRYSPPALWVLAVLLFFVPVFKTIASCILGFVISILTNVPGIPYLLAVFVIMFDFLSWTFWRVVTAACFLRLHVPLIWIMDGFLWLFRIFKFRDRVVIALSIYSIISLSFQALRYASFWFLVRTSLHVSPFQGFFGFSDGTTAAVVAVIMWSALARMRRVSCEFLGGSHSSPQRGPHYLVFCVTALILITGLWLLAQPTATSVFPPAHAPIAICLCLLADRWFGHTSTVSDVLRVICCLPFVTDFLLTYVVVALTWWADQITLYGGDVTTILSHLAMGVVGWRIHRVFQQSEEPETCQHGHNIALASYLHALSSHIPRSTARAAAAAPDPTVLAACHMKPDVTYALVCMHPRDLQRVLGGDYLIMHKGQYSPVLLNTVIDHQTMSWERCADLVRPIIQ